MHKFRGSGYGAAKMTGMAANFALLRKPYQVFVIRISLGSEKFLTKKNNRCTANFRAAAYVRGTAVQGSLMCLEDKNIPSHENFESNVVTDSRLRCSNRNLS